ncbi:MAG: hypothetical protein J7497_12280 [Chitinophagaceae bacterium]|nr:hypothetical protein [Chitinophagaceae bacterium]
MRKKPHPRFSWQKEDYSRKAEFSFILPQQFLLLCRLMSVTPRQMLVDFMDIISCGSWKREGREASREKLIDYFLEQGYGKQYYSTAEIKSIFKELDAIGLLYPFNATQELINEHTRWRETYHTWWFEKWFEKNKREL